MDIHAAVQDGDVIIMQWTMIVRRYPSTPVHGSTARWGSMKHMPQPIDQTALP